MKIDIPNDVPNVGSNIAMLQHEPGEFHIIFGNKMPGPEPAMRANVIVNTSPQHAKRLFVALAENIAKYEEKQGEIKIGGPSANAESRREPKSPAQPDPNIQ